MIENNKTERVVARYPKHRYQQKARRHLDLPWQVEYYLAYDGGSARWRKGYRTRLTARIAISWNMYVASWGGTADLIRIDKGN